MLHEQTKKFIFSHDTVPNTLHYHGSPSFGFFFLVLQEYHMLRAATRLTRFSTALLKNLLDDFTPDAYF